MIDNDVFGAGMAVAVSTAGTPHAVRTAAAAVGKHRFAAATSASVDGRPM